MRRVALIRYAILTLFLLHAGAADAGPCITDRYGGLVCGEGDNAIRVFAETTSPSGQFAFAWRSSVGVTEHDYGPEDIENLLIRVSDGKVLTKLGGSYWATGIMRANRSDLVAAWSPDSRAVVEVASSRWESDAFAYYALVGDAVKRLDLRALVKPAMLAKLPPRQREDQSFRVREDSPIALDKRGRLVFAAMLYVPKRENTVSYRVQVNVSSRRGSPVARIVSMQRMKDQ